MTRPVSKKPKWIFTGVREMQNQKKEEQVIERFIGLSKQNRSENDTYYPETSLREDKVRLLISNIPDVLWKIDRNNYIVYISDNIESVSGYTPEEEYEMGPRIGLIEFILTM